MSRNRLVLLLVFLTALAARLLFIGGKSLWADEAYAVGLYGTSLPEIVAASFRGSPHPPLALVIIQLSGHLFGRTEAGFRAIPALLSALAAVPLMLFSARKLGRENALLAGMLWAVCPFAVSLGQEAWIYGPMAFFGFLFMLVADHAWSGSRRALYLLVPLGLTGMLVQHLFLLFVLCGFSLYFTLRGDRRCPFRSFLAAGLVLSLIYLPFAFPAAAQASLRAQRWAAKDWFRGSTTQRLVSRIPTVLAQLLPGGVAPEFHPGFRLGAKDLTVLIAGLAASLSGLATLFTNSSLCRRLRIWAAAWTVLPLLLFLGEDPTVRHLIILWIPLGLGISSLRGRWRGPASAALLLATLILLVNYYRIPWYPYHRSDYRSAVALVEGSMTQGQRVVVMGGQNGGLAWDFYSEGTSGRYAVGGETPYDIQPVRTRFDRIAVLDSLLGEGGQTWVVHDIWGPPEGPQLAPGHRVLQHRRMSPDTEVLLFE